MELGIWYGKGCRWYLGRVGLASWEIRGSADLRKTLKPADKKTDEAAENKTFSSSTNWTKNPCWNQDARDDEETNKFWSNNMKT